MKPVEVKLCGGKAKIKEDTMLYCSSHGPGRVVSVCKREVLGEKLVFCQIEFQKDDMNILIPISKMKEMGIRTIISNDTAKRILDTVLNKPAKGAKGIWAKRIQEYETKLYSGSAIFVAEVVRDLFASIKDPNKSYGERSLFDKAFDRLTLEMSFALGYTIEETNKTIMDILNSNCKTQHIDISVDENEEDYDGDFDDGDFDTEDSDSCEDFNDLDFNKKKKSA
jgi:CarD family transcriptional regulator